MDAHDDLTMARGTTTTPDLAAIKRVYERILAEGVLPGIEELLSFSHEEIELRPYAAVGSNSPGGGRHEVLHGPAEIREFFQMAAQTGFKPQPRAKSFDVTADSVVVRGSIRLTRPDGSFAETKLRWKYRFRDGLVDSVSWEPRAGE